MPFFSSSIIPTIPTSTSVLVESINGAKEPMKLVPIPITIYTNNKDSQNSPGLTSQELPAFPVGPLDEVQAIKITPLTIDSAFTSVANLLTLINSDSAIDSAASISVVNSPTPVDLEPTKVHSHSYDYLTPMHMVFSSKILLLFRFN